MDCEDLDNKGWLSMISSSLDGNLPKRHWAQRWGEGAESEEDRGDGGELQQSNLALELHPRMGEGVRLGTVAFAAGGARPGEYHRRPPKLTSNPGLVGG